MSPLPNDRDGAANARARKRLRGRGGGGEGVDVDRGLGCEEWWGEEGKIMSVWEVTLQCK
jgi:hypothetical protein